ncbi:MAG: phosphoadenylyl-sulfate reductase [Oxalobacter sp.]|nr:MAG: phosphoadenylyl-sulfate reductase [Oxalobacter sp.]
MSDYSIKLTETLAVLERIASAFSPAVLASSLAAEDMVLTDMIFNEDLPIDIFTLDTGRLHVETLEMIARINKNYGASIDVYRPTDENVTRYIVQHGLNGFYESVESRQECCRIRKVEPLGRALSGKKAWLTGQRRAQAASRAELDIEEFDAAHGMPKFNPLANWSEDDVWNYIRSNKVPYNPLHDRGYPSIGCDPCTRAIRPGEDVRAGRWWWEGTNTKECGLHMIIGTDGKPQLVRSSAEANVSEANTSAKRAGRTESAVPKGRAKRALSE